VNAHTQAHKANNIMDSKTFFKLVEQMRKAQRKYFASRSSLWLQQSKLLEKEVDAEIDRVNTILNPQPKEGELF
jgi:hypothetical protein